MADGMDLHFLTPSTGLSSVVVAALVAITALIMAHLKAEATLQLPLHLLAPSHQVAVGMAGHTRKIQPHLEAVAEGALVMAQALPQVLELLVRDMLEALVITTAVILMLVVAAVAQEPQALRRPPGLWAMEV